MTLFKTKALETSLRSKGAAVLVVFLLTAFYATLGAQMKLNDPSIVAQHKRMVYESWGDFSPYPKYLLGVQTNLAYATVWGMWAPSRNRAYREGQDLRPLRVGGEETERILSLRLQERETSRVAYSVDSIYQTRRSELEYHSSLLVDADPLWQWYYEKRLSPVFDYPVDPMHFQDWNLASSEELLLLKSRASFRYLQMDLERLKDQVKISRTADMPRGKRILLYHKSLEDLRSFERKLAFQKSLLRYSSVRQAQLDSSTSLLTFLQLK